MRTAVIDDDAIVRDWLRLALADSEFRVVAEAPSAAAGIDAAHRGLLGLILVDYHLPDEPGTQVVRELRLRGVSTPVVLITAHGEQGLNETASESGAQATFVKSSDAAALLAVLRTVTRGERSFDTTHPARLPARVRPTPRELAVLRLAAGGATNGEIANELAISEATVKTLLARAFVKLGAGNRTQAVAEAMTLGIL